MYRYRFKEEEIHGFSFRSKSLYVYRWFSFRILFRNTHFFSKYFAIFRVIFCFFFDIISRVVIVLKKRIFTFHGFSENSNRWFLLSNFASKTYTYIYIHFSQIFRVIFGNFFFFPDYLARHNRVSIPFRKMDREEI